MWETNPFRGKSGSGTEQLTFEGGLETELKSEGRLGEICGIRAKRSQKRTAKEEEHLLRTGHSLLSLLLEIPCSSYS